MLLLCSVPRRMKQPPRKLEQEYEVQMLLKTDLAHQQALLDCLKSHHPYQTPELLVLPVTYGDNDYLSWLTASLR